MYKNRTSLLPNLGVIALSGYILKFCLGHNINTIRDINLQLFLNKRLFGEHPLVIPILLFSATFSYISTEVSIFLIKYFSNA